MARYEPKKFFTKSDAQAHMAKGTFVSHKSDQHIGFKLSRVGNIESHDGGVFSAVEFWYARKNESFDSGWCLYEAK